MTTRRVRIRYKGGVLEDVLRESPVDVVQRRFWRRVTIGLAAVLLLLAVWIWWKFLADRPSDFDDAAMHFKYGSIGSEPGGRLSAPVGGVLPPYPIFAVLPAMFPDRLPGGYASLGLIYEPGRELPVGISRRRRLGVDQVGLNCAVCHSSTYREADSSPRTVVLGMPAHRLDLQRFFRFILEASLDERFTAASALRAMEESGRAPGPVERLLYRAFIVPRIKLDAGRLMARIGPLLGPDVTPWGRGRVDTFNPYKAIQFNWNLSVLPGDELQAASDFPSLWAQRPREGMQLHWDGNNDSVNERNLSAALGAGVTPVTADHGRIRRVADWCWSLPAPEYPFAVDAARARRGAEVYRRAECGACHADHRFPEGLQEAPHLGKVTPIALIGTDRHRLDSYTASFCVNQGSLYPQSRYQFRRFRKTGGYANQPLDGLWARAPYLHNGSVPTLRDLLSPPSGRPALFYRGYDVYDQVRVGFVSAGASAIREGTAFDTRLAGNGNGGHLYGIDLSEADKDDLVEYLKTF